MTDAELLALVAEHKPSACALACIVAHRAGADTWQAIGERTGYSRAQLQRARVWLDDHAPEWRGETPDPYTDHATHVAARAEYLDAHPEIAEAPVPTLALEGLTEPYSAPAIVEIAANGHAPAIPPPPALWRTALQDAMLTVVGARSWDLYADVYAKAADVIHDHGSVDDLIALTFDYLYVVEDGADLDNHDRALVAKLVRQYGKAALYGLSQAIGRTDTFTMRDYYRYAQKVCQTVVAQIRDRQAEEAP